MLAQSTQPNDSFQVQARLQPWTQGSTVSVITMLAAQLGTDRVTFRLDRGSPVWVNGTPVTFAQNGAAVALSGGSSLMDYLAGQTTGTFTAYLTSATGTDTVIDWAVTAPDAGYFGAATFGATPPSGFVIVPAGQISATFTVTLPAGALGALPTGNLQVTISSTNRDPVFGHTAQTEIDNSQPVQGNPAVPQLGLLAGSGQFTGANNVYTLNLGTLAAGEGSLQSRLQLSNVALSPSDLLGATFAVTGSGFTNFGTQQLTPLSAQSSFQSLVIETDASQIGPQSETITINPIDENVTGYTGALAPITLKVTDTLVATAATAAGATGRHRLGRCASHHLRRALLQLPGRRRVHARPLHHIR